MMPLLGNVAENKKITLHQDQSMESSSNEGEECIYIPLWIASGSVQENGVDGVILVVIQITDDLAPNGRHLRVQHMYGWKTSPPT